MRLFADWDTFYVIVGSSAGALVGLQFVVMTLIAGRPELSSPEAGAAFATPNVVHFVVVLFLSAALSVPWHRVGSAAIAWGLAGVAGIAYIFVVIRRMKRQSAYRPVFEDWLFHALAPLAAYATLLGSACVAHFHTRAALFAVGAATLLLLAVGIHNAWDAVMYHVVTAKRAP